jgi:hypothetical protein
VDLIDLVGEKGIQQDEWSLTAPTFGKEDQLEVVGWSGKSRGRSKLYILKCNKCSQDSELFGDGYFKKTKGSILNLKVIPCGCARNPRWSKNQYEILCSRKAEELGYKFIGFGDKWEGSFTKIRMLCEEHGEWCSGRLSSLLNDQRGCPGCKAAISRKPDDVMITSFFASGGFHPESEFCRSDRKDSSGKKVFWVVSCPDCGETGESKSSHLQQGQRPCACSTQRQRECYINCLTDDNNTIVAIKFGIANNSKLRVKKQNSKSIYSVQHHSVYKFPTVKSCKKAERECKEDLECGIVLKRDMSDGYTETTWAYNLEKIVEIYEKNGGVIHDGYV